VLQRVVNRITSGSYLAKVAEEHVTAVRVEAGIKAREGLDGAMWPDPSPFTADRSRRPDEPAQPLEHPALPQRRVPAQIAAVSNQSVGVPHVLES
jgi:hypothetical protein